MATREENLKKINDELNKLSDEELDKVAGGTVGDTAEDSKLLYNYGLVDDWHGSIATGFYWGSYSAAVDEGWAKAGITCCTVPFGANKYWLDGKRISRDEAVAHLKKTCTPVYEEYDEDTQPKMPPPSIYRPHHIF